MTYIGTQWKTWSCIHDLVCVRLVFISSGHLRAHHDLILHRCPLISSSLYPRRTFEARNV